MVSRSRTLLFCLLAGRISVWLVAGTAAGSWHRDVDHGIAVPDQHLG